LTPGRGRVPLIVLSGRVPDPGLPGAVPARDLAVAAVAAGLAGPGGVRRGSPRRAWGARGVTGPAGTG